MSQLQQRRGLAGKLVTTTAEFDDLHAALARARAGTETVKVNRQALAHLLRDYSILVAVLKLDL